MQKTIFKLLLVTTFCLSNVQTTHALIVFDPTNFGQSLVDYAIQGYKLAKETVTSYASTVTAAQQTLETVNNTVLIPAASAMAVAQTLAQKNAIENLVLGSMGTESLLIRDPELYIKNKGIDVVNASLGDIASQKGLYSDSVLGSVISSQRFDALDLKSKITTINQSSILADEQKSRCAEASLSAQALRDVRKEDNSYNQAEYTARKTELNNALCGNLSDPKVKAAVKAVSSASPSWNSWLATTGGDNAYTKSVQTQEAIARAAEEKKQAATKDLASGGGIKSKTKCVKRAAADANGKPYSLGDISAPCVQEQILQASNVISDSFKSVLKAPADILKNAIAPGSGVLSLVNTAMGSYSLVQSITGSAESFGGGASGTTNNAGSGRIITYTPDLANNPDAKTAIASAPKEQLENQKAMIEGLAATDAKFITTLDSYQSSIEGVKACYDDLLANYDEARGRSQITSAQDFYTSKSAAITRKRVQIITEQGLIGQATALVDETIAQLDTSFSTQEILNIFLGYQDKVKARNLPDAAVAISREEDYVNFSGELQQSNFQGGQMFTLKADCNTTRQQIEAARAAANAGGA